jgi:glycerate-2-kinase
LNPESLCNHGNIQGRQEVIEILEAAMQAADPYNNAVNLVRILDDQLIVGNRDYQVSGSPRTGEEVFKLSNTGKIFVIGAGKGVQRVAKALEDVLGDHLFGGHVIDKHGAPIILKKIGVTLGAHPIPDENCIIGCQKILEVCSGLGPEDIVFTIAANGISSLLTLPVPGISLEEVCETTYLMQIERGVPTYELNQVRNHIDLMKGGRISMALQPARAIHIVAYDPDGFGRYESGWSEFIHHNVWIHTLPDCSTFQDAVHILKKWDAWDAVPVSIREHLLNADVTLETVKPAQFEKTWFRIYAIMPRKLGFLAQAEQKARELGYSSHTLCGRLETEASHAGEVIGSIALSIEREGVPFQPPCALFTWGEMVVTVGEQKGIGGRNQEFALAAALRIAGSRKIVIGAVDTDGTDGPGVQFAEKGENYPTLAGGMVDGLTVSEAVAAGISIEEELRKHNTTPPLLMLNSGIAAGHSISLSDFGVTLIMGPA